MRGRSSRAAMAPADVTFPESSKHGSFLEITKEEALRLRIVVE
jgi:hypothetical protein